MKTLQKKNIIKMYLFTKGTLLTKSSLVSGFLSKFIILVTRAQ